MTRLTSITARAPAKINIGWRVGELRPDGFHDVQGWICTVDLEDELRFEVDDSGNLPEGGQAIDIDGVPMRLHIPGRPDLEVDDNLVLGAARLMSEHAQARPTAITIDKRIPVGAGLGGGSSDAAATLLALNVAWGARLSASKIVAISADIGSDVPALVVGGMVHVSGRGEQVRQGGTIGGFGIMLGISHQPLRTADVYGAFDDLEPPDRSAFQSNDLQAAALSLRPELAGQLEAMRKAGADAALVSGSGPTVVGVVVDATSPMHLLDGLRPQFDQVEWAIPCSGCRVEARRP